MIQEKNNELVYMTPVELERIRLKLGISVACLSRVLGLNVVTIHNMRSGRQRIRQFNALSIRWLEALWELSPHHIAIPIELRISCDNINE